MFTDTHFHLEKGQGAILEEAMQVDVQTFIVSCCDKNSIIDLPLLLDLTPSLYFSVGYHPSEADTTTDADLEELERLIQKTPSIVAVGEIGLDYHYGKENKDKQMALFRKQLSIAERLSLPVVIHSRDAVLDTIRILKEYSLKGVIHCFSGSIETAEEYLKMGYLLGIGGVVTFSNSKLYQVVEKFPLSSFVLETDSPYLAPVPFRGSVNTPCNIPVIAKRISEIKGVTLSEVAHVTTQNAYRLFDLEKHL